MVLWGGLRPIASRAVIDGLTLAVWAAGTRHVDQRRDAVVQSYLWILCACIVAIYTAGNLTNRWTLTLPMGPFLVLQGLRRLIPSDDNDKKTKSLLCYLRGFLTLLSWMCILAAIALCLLFPAVELPPVNGPYFVGKVDLFLPVNNLKLDSSNAAHQSPAVWVRVLYPTLEPPVATPYLTPVTALDYCRHSMTMGAPPPLKALDWILHTWRLTNRWEREGAALMDARSNNDSNKSLLPVVVYSHGLGGHADIYSFQTHSLAAAGNVVVSITHTDGSSPVVHQPNGGRLEFDYTPLELERTAGYNHQVIAMRRNQTEWRVQEVLAATHALRRWNDFDIHDDLPGAAAQLSFKGRLNLQQVTWMGHSFGGATVLTAAHRHADLVHTVVAHEPALDWAHPSTLASLFAQPRIANLTLASTYNYNLWGSPSPDDDSLHQAANIMLLFSHQWVQKGWASTPLIQEMQQHGRLGSNQTRFHFDYVPDMHHNEFSDTGMLTPTWLARAVGLTGPRNPIDSARDVAQRTLAFLDSTRGDKS